MAQAARPAVAGNARVDKPASLPGKIREAFRDHRRRFHQSRPDRHRRPPAGARRNRAGRRLQDGARAARAPTRRWPPRAPAPSVRMIGAVGNDAFAGRGARAACRGRRRAVRRPRKRSADRRRADPGRRRRRERHRGGARRQRHGAARGDRAKARPLREASMSCCCSTRCRSTRSRRRWMPRAPPARSSLLNTAPFRREAAGCLPRPTMSSPTKPNSTSMPQALALGGADRLARMRAFAEQHRPHHRRHAGRRGVIAATPDAMLQVRR